MNKYIVVFKHSDGRLCTTSLFDTELGAYDCADRLDGVVIETTSHQYKLYTSPGDA